MYPLFLSVGYIVHKIIHTVSIYYKLCKYFFDILFIFCKKKCNFEAYFYCLATNTKNRQFTVTLIYTLFQ